MKIKIKKIERHKSFPFMTKAVVLDIDGTEQPLCMDWELETTKDGWYKMNVDDDNYGETHVYLFILNKIISKIKNYVRNPRRIKKINTRRTTR